MALEIGGHHLPMVAHDLFRHRANIPNTAFYKITDIYRGMSHRHTIMMNPADIANGGLAAHQRVKVQGEAGELAGIEAIPGSIRRGAALKVYPEANVLMRAVIDAESGTPGFKRVPVPVLVLVLVLGLEQGIADGRSDSWNRPCVTNQLPDRPEANVPPCEQRWLGAEVPLHGQKGFPAALSLLELP